jgi:6-phosphogluconolactonase
MRRRTVRNGFCGSSRQRWTRDGQFLWRLMFGHLARTRFDWRQVHLFFVDERCVGPADEESNYRMCEESFIRPAHFPVSHVHRIKGELRPDDAARLYSEEIAEFFGLAEGELPAFDVIHRGMGADAHTASLFPGEPLIDDREGICAAVWVTCSMRRMTR